MVPPSLDPATSVRRAGLSIASMVAYGSGNFAFALLGLVITVNLQFFYTDYVGLSAGLVAWSLLFAKVFDSVTDPLMGYLSDRTHTRFGRRRPYFLGTAIPLAVAFYFLFTPPAVTDGEGGQVRMLAYMLTLYILTYLFWTIGAVPYFSLGAELTDDYQERVKLITVREACALAGLLLATISPAYLIHVYGGLVGYSFMGAILGAGTAITLIVSAIACHERPEFQGRAPMNPYAGWLATLKNPHFRPLLLAFSLSAVAGAVPAVLVIYISIYVIGTPHWWTAAVPGWMPTWSYYLLLYFSSGVLSLPFWNRVAAVLGKRNTWTIAIVMASTTSLACTQLTDGSVLYFSVILMIGGAAFGNTLSLPPAMVADIIDWDEARTGRRREGSYFAIWAFATKLGAAITGFVALQVLEHVGYEPGVEQTETVKWWLVWMYSWFPAAFYGAAGLALSSFHFTRADLLEAQREVGRLP
ncbi:MAG: MFS transporter [Candidatus Binatia bacterium]|nr:MFS transporter [Candidatus Binatia bacterium]